MLLARAQNALLKAQKNGFATDLLKGRLDTLSNHLGAIQKHQAQLLDQNDLSGPNDMNLDPESEGIVMRVARLAPDALRDGFFSGVARRLKYLRNITPQDVRYACSAALGELKQQEHRRAG